mmetsp:Transcript_3089/g.5444  ORF Transcript_3089/g.5444 Transcript_3089/m.5444 type:complete len:168 (-) Transcript_3089:34-537(-)
MNAISVIDSFFFLFFTIFLICVLFIDPFGLLLESWPPAFIQEALTKYAEYCDPLYASGVLWHKVLIAIEVFIYPPFIITCLAALYRGISRSPWVKIPSLVLFILVWYSYAVIIAHNFFGEDPDQLGTQQPMVWWSAYFMFLVAPPLFVVRTYTATYENEFDPLKKLQ